MLFCNLIKVMNKQYPQCIVAHPFHTTLLRFENEASEKFFREIGQRGKNKAINNKEHQRQWKSAISLSFMNYFLVSFFKVSSNN